MMLFTFNVKAFEPFSYDIHLIEVRNYIDHFHKNVGKHLVKKYKFAKNTIAPLVVKHSLYRNLDPLLSSVTISYESSWIPMSLGKKGEKGLMQVMRPKPKNLEDEIILGTNRLKYAVESCNNTFEALTHYASGSCKPRTERTKNKMKFRYNKYKEAIKKFRKK